jgi:hypothetical protein
MRKNDLDHCKFNSILAFMQRLRYLSRWRRELKMICCNINREIDIVAVSAVANVIVVSIIVTWS